MSRNDLHMPKARIFSYLTIDEGRGKKREIYREIRHFKRMFFFKLGEELPGYLACESDGSFKKLEDGENLITKMSNYYEYLSSSTYSSDNGLWTSPYIDSGGQGLTITYAVPSISKIDRK